MRTTWGVLMGAACIVAVVGAVCVVAPECRAAQPPAKVEEGPKEVGIKGEVARGPAEDSWVIKVAFGKKKVISYEVAPESPKRRELSGLGGKTVEATGVMKKGPNGENLFVLTSVAESVAQK
jgi:hypothetical protein